MSNDKDDEKKPVDYWQYPNPEQKSKGKFVLEIRGTTKGGIPAAYGYRNKQHCYLDYMLDNNHLDGAESGLSAKQLYDAGYELRHLWFKFNVSGKSCCEQSSGGDSSVIEECHIGDDRDIAETRFIRIMRRLGTHSRIVRYVCIEDITPCDGEPDFYKKVRRALSELSITFQSIKKINLTRV